ncbi:MAG: hypothetical protein GY852_06510, partial [bacterium]|nr:hypothetical protein [bacterium]
MSEIKEYLQRASDLINSRLQEILPAEKIHPSSIHTLMRYSTFAGGKRVRPGLLLAANEACGDTFGNKNAVDAGAALEMLHTFSLMHDDLPCMDDADFR